MSDRGIRRWALLGALVSTALLAPACGRSIPKEGTSNEGRVNEAQKVRPSGAEQQQATGGSGFQPSPQGGAQQLPQGQEGWIGAPGYSSPRENPMLSPYQREPNPQLKESGSYKPEQRLNMQENPRQ